jgi:hypothetical protein
VAVSLRRTLVLRFGLTMAVALGLIGWWIHARVEDALRHELEESLASPFSSSPTPSTASASSRFGPPRSPTGTSCATTTR